MAELVVIPGGATLPRRKVAYRSFQSPNRGEGQMAGRAEIHLIGTFSLSTSKGFQPMQRTSTRLLAFLSLKARRVSRAEVAAGLWPEQSERRAQGNLRAAIWRLGPIRSLLLDSQDDTLRLRPDSVIDLDELRRRCTSALRFGYITDGLGQDPKLLNELLPTVTDDWTEPARERWRQMRLHMLSQYTEQLCNDDRAYDAAALLYQALGGAPNHETLQATADRARCMMRVQRPIRKELWRPTLAVTNRAGDAHEVNQPKEMSI